MQGLQIAAFRVSLHQRRGAPRFSSFWVNQTANGPTSAPTFTVRLFGNPRYPHGGGKIKGAAAWADAQPPLVIPAHRLSPAILPIGSPTQTATSVSGYQVAPGVYERRFTGGIVVANVSGASVTVNLGGTYKTVSGSSLGSVTLANGNGAVLVSG
jgi:hypothetical protein